MPSILPSPRLYRLGVIPGGRPAGLREHLRLTETVMLDGVRRGELLGAGDRPCMCGCPRLKISGIREYLGHFDYLSGSGRASRQLNFAVDVAAPEPVELSEHDTYPWSPPTDEPPVTDAVKAILARYQKAQA